MSITIADLIPVFFSKDAKLNAFSDKFQSIIDDIQDDILGLNTLLDPFKINSSFLTVLGNYLNAGINSSDDEHTKRIKIATAVQGHKIRGSWNFDAKPKIDAIAGGDAKLLTSIGTGEWIFVGDGETPASYYLATLGGDGIDDELGLFLLGAGDEIEISGNVYIDVDNVILTALEQENIRLSMLDIVPAYYIVHFGYLDGAGIFQEYFVME